MMIDKKQQNAQETGAEAQCVQPRYSVIIPIYNAENTLNRCLDSLLSCDYPASDRELILVNDGSADSSLSICREYSFRYDNIRVIDKPNGGVSSARNAGLDTARGRFILFADSDDYVVPDFFRFLDEAVGNEPSDFIQFSICIDSGADKREAVLRPVHLASRDKLTPHIVDSICRKTINGPWAKLFRRDIIEKHSIRFPEGSSIGEDRAFNIVYSLFCRSFDAKDRVVYVLNTENTGSLSRKRHANQKQELNIAEEYILRELTDAPLVDKEKRAYREALNFGICTEIFHSAKLLIKDGIGWMDRQKNLFRLCREINSRHMKYPKTLYCLLASLPIRLYITPTIDSIARKLVRSEQ